MNIFQFSVRRPVATSMFFIGLMVLGIYSYTRLPVDLFPEVEIPVLAVLTTYQGAGALEIEQNITDPMESFLGTVPNLDKISSNSMDDVSLIILEFTDNTDMGEAANDVRDRIGRLRQFLPDDADEPIIQKFDPGAIPVIIYSATAEESFAELETIIDDYLAGPINRLPGVGDVSITGAPIIEVQVTLDPERLEAYGLSIHQIAQALQTQNIAMGTGRVDLGDDSFNLRVNSEFQDLDDIREVIVANYQGRQIRLDQVAQVYAGFADDEAISRVNLRRGVTFSVQKQSDANVVQVAERVHARMPALIETLPPDVNVEVIIDTSEFVVESITNLQDVILYALLFVILVVWLFLRQWRATLVIAAVIPVSLIVAFIYLAMTGSTLNIISLSSLSIALGLVVDDAIVVLENIMSHLERGSRPWQAAIYATREVAVAVLAATWTVVAVFLPLTFLSGPMGMWFAQFGAIVTIAVLTSLITAVTLTPMMSSLLLRKQKEGPIARTIDQVMKGLEFLYEKSLRIALRFRKTVVLIAVLLFGGSLMLVPYIGTEFMPVSDTGTITINGELATSRGLQYTSQVAEEIEKEILANIEETRLISSTAGQSGGMIGVSGGQNAFVMRMRLVDLDERERSAFEIADQIREILFARPEVVDYSVQAGDTGMGGPAPEPIAVEILGHDLEETSALAQRFADFLSGVEGTRDVSISRGKPRPEFEFVFDQQKLSDFGLTSAQVASVLQGNVAGMTATRYRIGGKEYDVVLRFDEEHRNSLRSLEEMTITTPTGQRVRVNQLGTLREFEVPPNIERSDRDRMVKVSSGLQGQPLNVVMAQVQQWIDEQDLPPQIEMVITGDFEDQQEAFQDLFLIMILSMVLVYLVMAAQFESLREPFIIMFSLPFAFTGVILALLITDTPLGVIGLLGAIILVGIVVKNAIVLIDFVKLLIARDYPIVEAIVQGSVSRLRPILMTSMTTVLAMAPMAIGVGEGAETWQPMGISVIGGLTFSTLVTLIVVPVIYGMFNYRLIRKQQQEEQQA